MCLAVCVAVVFACAARAADTADPIKQPNIIFILVDDLGKEWVSCYGAEDIQTPHIDKLAVEGMRFENAWCMPQCTPTRVTLLTGQYPFHHGWTNHWDVPRWGCGAHFDPSMNPCYPKALRAAGYATAIAGKWQIDDFRVEPDAMDEAGFDAWCMWTGYESGNKPSRERYHDPYVYRKGEKSRLIKGTFGPDLYCDYLIDFMRANHDKPFFVYYPMALTHSPQVSTPDEPNADSKLDKHKAMVRYTDKIVGRIVAAIEELGIRDHTYIVFTTDNGSPASVTGRRLGHAVRGAKVKMTEAGTAMPFIVTGPGVRRGVVTDALTDFTDIAPTFVDLAGATMPKDHVIDGISIAPLLRGETNDTRRDWIMSMGGHNAKFRDGQVVPDKPYDDRVMRDKQYKVWIGYDREIEQLYDMQADPWERTNLIDSNKTEHRAALEKFQRIVATFPDTDAAPRYKKNPPQPWDRPS
jgi:arylsulfatase A-like enzyme